MSGAQQVRHGLQVIIADDHPLIRKALKQVIESSGRMCVVGEASDGEEALSQIGQLQPQVAVLDIEMPKQDGFAVAREIRRQQWPTEVVFLTMHNNPALLHSALQAGAKGYLLKESALQEIVAGLETIASGQLYVSAALLHLLLQHRNDKDTAPQSGLGLEVLTQTERQILRAVAENKSSKDIAVEFSIHYRTVDNHRTNICQKLGLRGPNALLKFALQHRSEF